MQRLKVSRHYMGLLLICTVVVIVVAFTDFAQSEVTNDPVRSRILSRIRRTDTDNAAESGNDLHPDPDFQKRGGLTGMHRILQNRVLRDFSRNLQYDLIPSSDSNSSPLDVPAPLSVEKPKWPPFIPHGSNFDPSKLDWLRLKRSRTKRFSRAGTSVPVNDFDTPSFENQVKRVRNSTFWMRNLRAGNGEPALINELVASSYPRLIGRYRIGDSDVNDSEDPTIPIKFRDCKRGGTMCKRQRIQDWTKAIFHKQYDGNNKRERVRIKNLETIKRLFFDLFN